MLDPYGRRITYLRVSVTDRCDLRCVYCMSEDMTFLPRAEVLSLEELDRLCGVFIRQGVRKLRLTGGEPLVRRDVISLFQSLGARIGMGLDELTLTTNGTQLAAHAEALRSAGVRRVNVSLDTLDGAKFTAITRRGRIERTLDGIFAAKAAGLAVKVNAVALRGINEDEFDDLISWCGLHGFDLCLIETMPMGEVEGDRTEQYLPLSLVQARLRRRWTLEATDYRTGGPARYYTVAETGRRIGFITPMTHNFCEFLQPGPADLHRDALHVPGAGGRSRPPPRAAGRRLGRGTRGGHSRSHRPQTQRARLHHRSAARSARRRPPHERDWRLKQAAGPCCPTRGGGAARTDDVIKTSHPPSLLRI